MEKINRILGIKDGIKNAAVTIPEFTPEIYEEYKKRFFLALQKYQTSRKTRAVHKLIENNQFIHALFVGDFHDKIVATQFSENKLYMVNLNGDKFSDFAVDEGSARLIMKINDLIKEIEEHKTMISEQRIYNLKKLIKLLIEKQQKFIDLFDYMKSIDGLYYGYISFLTRRILISNPREKAKIIKVFADILTEILIKIYRKATKTGVDKEVRKKLEIISSYFILNYYFGLKSIEIFPKIRDIYGIDAVEFLKKSKKLKMENFEDIVDLLFETDTIKFQKNLFNSLMISLLGELGYSLFKFSIKDAISFLCSINHKNILFNAINPDEKLTFRLEELILNEKSKIILVPQKPPIIEIDKIED